MTNLRRETRRLGNGLIVSGTMTFALAAIALAFPEPTLIGGMLIVGLSAVMFGLSQVLTATSLRLRTRHWRLLLSHGILCLTFGLLTVGASALTLALAVTAVAVWLVSHGALAVRVATSIPVTPSIRRALFTLAVFDTTVAILVIALREVTIFQFLFFGAAYAVVFGIVQLVAGICLRGARLDKTGRSHAEESSHNVHA
jgi:hypothetical protein